MKNIVVIGAGTMGNGIAHVFAMKGFQVTLADRNTEILDRARATIDGNLARMVKKGTLPAEEQEQTLSRLTLATDASAALATADLMIEAATENLDLKKKIFQQADQLAPPHAILASNTSSISIGEIASATGRASQVIGMHFMNPVPVMKLVEVIRGKETDDATNNTIVELARQLDKTPVESNDFPGFITNRILMPMLNEAIFTLYEGVAGAEEIDTAMKLGMGHPMGPLTLADFIGLDVCLFILEVMQAGLNSDKYAPCPLLVEMVKEGKLGRKTGQGFYTYAA